MAMETIKCDQLYPGRYPLLPGLVPSCQHSAGRWVPVQHLQFSSRAQQSKQTTARAWRENYCPSFGAFVDDTPRFSVGVYPTPPRFTRIALDTAPCGVEVSECNCSTPGSISFPCVKTVLSHAPGGQPDEQATTRTRGGDIIRSTNRTAPHSQTARRITETETQSRNQERKILLKLILWPNLK